MTMSQRMRENGTGLLRIQGSTPRMTDRQREPRGNDEKEISADCDGVNMTQDSSAVWSADSGALGTTLYFGKSATGFSGVRAPETWQQIKVQYSPHIIGEEAEFIINRSDLPRVGLIS